MAEQYGFESVLLEELSFKESLRVFREAEVIVGPHGAGWANLLFCNSAAKALLWTWEGEKEDNWYENIAYVCGVNYVQLGVPVCDDPWLDKRNLDYHLDPIVFERGLRALLARPSAVGLH